MALKSREYNNRIKSVGFEKATAWALTEVMEEVAQLEKNQIGFVEQLTQVINILDQFSMVTANMKDAFEKLSRRVDPLPDDMNRPTDDRVQ